MNEQKKQNILTAIIIILVLTLVLLIGSIVYEEVINIKKQPIQNTNVPSYNEEEKEEIEEINPNEDNVVSEENDNTIDEEEIDTEADKESKEEELPVEDSQKEEYVGEEENTTTEKTEISVEDKVIDLVKKEWGQDSSVTFNIEKKNGTKYRVAVRDNSTTVLAWYEVDTQNWKVSEY